MMEGTRNGDVKLGNHPQQVSGLTERVCSEESVG
jgi:hypothetical protein